MWHDNSIVSLASNCIGAAPVHSTTTWSQSQKKKIDVPQPHLIRMYNKYMGGVDRLDENIAKLRFGIRMKKWWWPLFSWLLSVSVQNAWQIYKEIGQSQEGIDRMDFLEFTRRIVWCYLFRSQQRVRGRPPSRVSSSRVIPEIRYDRLDHLVCSTKKQMRCGLCHKKVKRMCTKCKIGLHVDCFVPFHTK